MMHSFMTHPSMIHTPFMTHTPIYDTPLYVTYLYLTLPLYSTAQLLEPFCREHDIRVSVLGPEIDGRPSSLHSNVMHHATTPTVSSGGELEDPPGLYEKVSLLSLICV